MKKIFEGKIYDIVPKSDGIIFSYQKAVIDEGEVVCFKMISIENSLMTDIGKNIYWNEKFGSNYHAALQQGENFVMTKSIPLALGRAFLCDENGNAYLIDSNGSAALAGEIKHHGNPPSSIAFYKNNLWATFESTNVLMRFNINTMRNELRVGGKVSPFNRPKNIYIEDDTAYICNAGSNNIVKINLESYAIDEYRSFEESPLGFVKSGGFEFVLLESGLYLM